MGMVLSFSPRAAAGSRQRPDGELAAVIIFPGVRYERLDQTADAPKVATPTTSAH